MQLTIEFGYGDDPASVSAARRSSDQLRSLDSCDQTVCLRPDSPADPSFHAFRPDLSLAPGHQAFAVSTARPDGRGVRGSGLADCSHAGV
jgi:hypothetical protein